MPSRRTYVVNIFNSINENVLKTYSAIILAVAHDQFKNIDLEITNNQVITGSLDKSEVSIASISKLMTVYTVLKANQDLDEKLTVQNKKTPEVKKRGNNEPLKGRPKSVTDTAAHRSIESIPSTK